MTTRRRHRLSRRLSRRRFIASSAAGMFGFVGVPPSPLLHRLRAQTFETTSRQATGVKVGEVTDTSAIVWTRITADPARRNDGHVVRGKGRAAGQQSVPSNPSALEGACPGAPGRVRIRFSDREDLAEARETPWIDLSEKTDFAHQFLLTDLRPATVYHFSSETSGPGGSPSHAALRGRFETAPQPNDASDVTFCVVTGLMYADLDHRDGFHIFPAMQRLKPKFVVLTGDSVYFDNEQPQAVNAALARYHWERMYSLPRHVELLRHVPAYWEKDDHDTLSDDCWPGMKLGDLTFAEGQEIFREQVPIGNEPYRTVRWGKDLQIWLTEGRDFRSPNKTPDGPSKTIWGAAQKEWLQRTIKASDAKWKVLVSPTPIVGPDRGNKNDNHANKGFTHEGNEFRQWVRENVAGNFFVCCGDRHWQYHSVHPATALNEFSCGPASDEHAGGSPGLDKEYHRFHRMKGGFLSVTIRGGAITFRHHDVHGQMVYEWSRS